MRVVPYVGTWIEINHFIKQRDLIESRSLRGNVDRNLEQLGYKVQVSGRSLRGNVDRNVIQGSGVSKMVLSFPTWERG